MNEVVAPSAIEALQRAMLKLPQAALATEHHFADGMYLRSIFRPAGTLIVGKVHKKEHFYIVAKGCVQIASASGSVTHRAPAVLVSSPGTKRAVLALEDSVCMTIHRTAQLDLDAIEEELVETDATSPYGPGNVLKGLGFSP
jgi:hypothetical protein